MDHTTERSTREQVREALAVFNDARIKARDAAAAFNELTKVIGKNEKQRAEAEKRMPPETFAGLMLQYTDAEHTKVAAAAERDTAEKVLNTLRDILNSEVAEIWRDISAERAMTATIEDTTAQRLVMVQSKRTTDTPAPYRFQTTNGADDPDGVPF